MIKILQLAVISQPIGLFKGQLNEIKTYSLGKRREANFMK